MKRKYTYENIIDANNAVIDSFINNPNEYISFLKTMGSNYKNNFANSLSIYKHKKEATYCSSYEEWGRLHGRYVKKGEKGIPTINARTKYIKYVFDISQTSRFKESNLEDPFIWEYEDITDMHILNEVKEDISLAPINDNIIGNRELYDQLFKNSNADYTEFRMIDMLVSHVVERTNVNLRGDFDDVLLTLNNLPNISLDRNLSIELDCFMKESLKVIITHRLGIVYDVNYEDINAILNIICENKKIMYRICQAISRMKSEILNLFNMKYMIIREQDPIHNEEIKNENLTKEPSASNNTAKGVQTLNDGKYERIEGINVNTSNTYENIENAIAEGGAYEVESGEGFHQEYGTHGLLRQDRISREGVRTEGRITSRQIQDTGAVRNGTRTGGSRIHGNAGDVIQRQGTRGDISSDRLRNGETAEDVRRRAGVYDRDVLQLRVGDISDGGVWRDNTSYSEGHEGSNGGGRENICTTGIFDVETAIYDRTSTRTFNRTILRGEDGRENRSSEVFGRNSISINGLQGEIDRREYEEVGINRGIERDGSREVRGIDEQPEIGYERSGQQRGDRILNSEDVETKGADTAPFFYDKEDSTDLMQKDIIEKGVQEFKGQDSISELKEDYKKEKNENYWIVEFNERSSPIEKNYAGQILTKEMLDEIKELDEMINSQNEGYFKFYFDHIVDGEVNENCRVDIGDGTEINQEVFAYLYQEIEHSNIFVLGDVDNGKLEGNNRNTAIDSGSEEERNVDEIVELDIPQSPVIELLENEFGKVDNFRFSEDAFAKSLTPSERLNFNIEAISMLIRLESGERKLDISSQEVLSKYVGWGGLSEVFDETKQGQWQVAREFLKENISSSDYEAARGSTLTAFYTPMFIMKGMYNALAKMGFKEGKILEPSMGIGNFIGTMPQDMCKSNVYGVELDSISGRIAKCLYPNCNIAIQGFEETHFSNGFFDIAIGNVPFGDFKVIDNKYNKKNFLIHDYFFAKSLDKVRSGGIVAFITSSGTMDKKDIRIRKYIAQRAELIGAIRLPNNTFKSVAGTEVTSDIIFLKKRDAVDINVDESWMYLGYINGIKCNKYYADNPDMVLGNIEEVNGRFGTQIECIADSNADIEKLLEKATDYISKSARYEVIELDEEELETIPATDDIKNFSFALINGSIYYRENSVLIKKDYKTKQAENIEEYIELLSSLKNVIALQMNDANDILLSEAQKKLSDIYDKYSDNHGYINSKSNARLLREDSNYPLVASIENLKLEDGQLVFDSKSDIFSKRTIKIDKEIVHTDTALEALILSISNMARVDFEYMRELTGNSIASLTKELGDEIFLNVNSYDKDRFKDNMFLMIDALKVPNENSLYSYVTADEYLSGNIRDKISILEAHIYDYESYIDYSDLAEYDVEEIKEFIERLRHQKEKLLEVLPAKIKASDITIRLGATWIPEKYIEEFMYETFKVTSYYDKDRIKVHYSEAIGEWTISNKSRMIDNIQVHDVYGTKKIGAYKILENALNLRETKVYYKGDDGKSYVDRKETLLIAQKQELIGEKFKEWIFNTSSRRQELENIYNIKFNSVRNRAYNGSNLILQGINQKVELKVHQRNAIARILYSGNTLLAHAVGAGKTYEMIAGAMESKRLGLCTKSLFVVPKHLTVQTGNEFMKLYPTANILVAGDDDFDAKRRKRFICKIATGDYDAIIIGHTQFEKIPMSREYQEEHIQEQIDTIILKLEEYRSIADSTKARYTIKQLEKAKMKLKVNLAKLNCDADKDDILTFEELGVDRIFIDEAHAYKNLYLYTKMANVSGIGTSDAKKSSDMFMKCRYIDEITDNKGIIFATGTPISNSMSEMYTMQRYLQYSELKRQGLLYFDSWASTFGETCTSSELAPEGNAYRVKTRFSKFYNLPELMSMFKEVADIQTADMLDLEVPEAMYHVIRSEPTVEQKEILNELSIRAEAIRDKKIDPKEDNMLLITNDGKKLALDQRLINPLLPDNSNSKINMCVENVFTIWKDTQDNRSAQLLFSDMSVPDKDKFNIYYDIRDKLIYKGVPTEEIAFIHDAKSDNAKELLFENTRKGNVRILMGSTQMMGAGTNVQDKLIALHDIDVPWRPSDLEQRAGRIIRKGNENKKVDIYRYVTEDTFDSYLWGIIENKQRFISQIMTSKTPVRVAEDVDMTTLSYSEIKALATGNPLIKDKMTLDIEVTKLKLLESNYKANKYNLEDKIVSFYPRRIAKLEQLIESINSDLKMVEPKAIEEDRYNSIIIDGKVYTSDTYDKKEVGEKLLEAIKSVKLGKPKKIGVYRNMELKVEYDLHDNEYKFNLLGSATYSGTFSTNALGNLIRLDNVIDNKIKTNIESATINLANTKEQYIQAKEEVSKPFEKADILREKLCRLNELNYILESDTKVSEQVEVSYDCSNDEEIKDGGRISILGAIRDYNDKRMSVDNEGVEADIIK